MSVEANTGQKCFRKPHKHELEQRRIVVTTLGTAHYLYDLDLDPGWCFVGVGGGVYGCFGVFC